MNDTSKNILLSDVQGQGFLSIFNDLSSELMPHERSLLELMEGLDYEGFDSSLRRDASVDPNFSILSPPFISFALATFITSMRE